MSLYGEYIKETQDKEIIEDDYGFATFYPAFDHRYMYIEDIYVKSNKRKEKKASDYADRIAKIAKERGISKLLGSVNMQIKNPTRSAKVLLSYGFRLLEVKEDSIYFEKDIE